MSKVYSISRENGVVKCDVFTTEENGITSRPLTHRVRHSPTGFEYGYVGSGPADLALSIMWDAISAEPSAFAYQRFKEVKLARLQGNGPHEITHIQILEFLMVLLLEDFRNNFDIDIPIAKPKCKRNKAI